MSITSTDVLIIGGGVAGLGCLVSLPATRKALLLEGEAELGGLLRVHRFGKYVFDTVPHVLFFRDKRLLASLSRLLPVPFRKFQRTNTIWQNGRSIGYPYQFNACDLPLKVRNDCIGGVQGVRLRNRKCGTSFQQWLLDQFGPGFYHHFFQPYNEKLYGVKLSEIEAGPLRWTIPRNNRSAIISGATRPHPASTAFLYYPGGERGIAGIIDALASLRSRDILTQERVKAVDVSCREVTTTAGRKFRYKRLVTTQPLPSVIQSISQVPEAIRQCTRELRAVGIHVIRVGARESGHALQQIWTYFPDPEVPFYRMTRLEQISPDLCPPHATAILLESTRSEPPTRSEVVRHLVRLGVLKSPEIEHFSVQRIPVAYVLFLRGYQDALRQIRRFLQTHYVFPVGRYGGWIYADIEMALKSGISAARRLLEGPEQLRGNLQFTDRSDDR